MMAAQTIECGCTQYQQEGAFWVTFVILSLVLITATGVMFTVGGPAGWLLLVTLGATTFARSIWRASHSSSSYAPAAFHHRCGSKLHVETYEADVDSDVVLLIHGMLASGRYWEHTAAELQAAGYTLIVPDCLGFGRSPWPLDAESYTVSSHVAHLAEALSEALSSHEGGGALHIVGHSLGGVFALELCEALHLQGSQRVASVCLLGAPAFHSVAEARAEVCHQPPSTLDARLCLCLKQHTLSPVIILPRWVVWSLKGGCEQEVSWA